MKGDAPRDVDDLLKQVQMELNGRVDALVRGAPVDYPAYQNLVGVLSGLRIAEQRIKALLDHLDDRDDSDT